MEKGRRLLEKVAGMEWVCQSQESVFCHRTASCRLVIEQNGDDGIRNRKEDVAFDALRRQTADDYCAISRRNDALEVVLPCVH